MWVCDLNLVATPFSDRARLADWSPVLSLPPPKTDPNNPWRLFGKMGLAAFRGLNNSLESHACEKHMNQVAPERHSLW